MCEETLDCTHYAWSDFEGGTCWLKKGSVSKNDAIPVKNNMNERCGLIFINWQGHWANNCDFPGNDLKSIKSPPELCSVMC
ncbi:unnamed protein product, partial [Brachionus calyciflorus]